MIVDTSAIVAMLQLEPEATAMLKLLSPLRDTKMSAGTYLECGIVVDKAKDSKASANFDALLRKLNIAIEAVTPDQARIARQAYRDFGKHSGHPAKLNFGDCFAYALAKECAEPLLYKGDDFARAGLDRVVG
jgi:ribonuclease VapC